MVAVALKPSTHHHSLPLMLPSGVPRLAMTLPVLCLHFNSNAPWVSDPRAPIHTCFLGNFVANSTHVYIERLLFGFSISISSLLHSGLLICHLEVVTSELDRFACLSLYSTGLTILRRWASLYNSVSSNVSFIVHCTVYIWSLVCWSWEKATGYGQWVMANASKS